MSKEDCLLPFDQIEIVNVDVISYDREKCLCYVAKYCDDMCCVTNADVSLAKVEAITGKLPEQLTSKSGYQYLDKWYIIRNSKVIEIK